MNDWDDLETEALSDVNGPGPRCGVWFMLEGLDDKARASIARALDNVRLTTSSIHRALEKRVQSSDLPSAYTLARHRAGRCSCDREAS